MFFQWCKKVVSSAKDTVKGWLPRPKPPAPLTARDKIHAVISYIEQIIKRGVGIGENIALGGWNAFPTPETPIHQGYIAPFFLAAFFGKFFHRSDSSIKRLIALLSRNFIKLSETMPALLGVSGAALAVVGASLEPGSPGLIAVFFTSLALSLSKFLLDKKFAKKAPQTQASEPAPVIEEAPPSKGRRLMRWLGRQMGKLPPLAKNVLLPIFKKAGQGALLKKVFSYFIIVLYQEEGWVNQNAEPAAAASPWLYLFIILPLAMKISLLIAEKATASEQKRGVENVDIGFEAVTNGGESFALVTLAVAKIIASLDSGEISDEQYFASMGVGALSGVLGGYFSVEKSLKQRKKQALGVLPDLDVILDEESQIGMLADELVATTTARRGSPDSSSYATIMTEVSDANRTSQEAETVLASSSLGSAVAPIGVCALDRDQQDTVRKDAALVDLHSETDYNMSRSLTGGAVVTQVDTRDESSDEDEALLRRASLSYST